VAPGWLSPITTSRATIGSSRQMMPWVALGATHHVVHNAYKWSAEPASHYSTLSTRLAGHNDSARPHVLLASTALTRAPWDRATKPWNHASVPWEHVGVPFFIHASHGS
jgi:hypothetical protein